MVFLHSNMLLLPSITHFSLTFSVSPARETIRLFGERFSEA